MEDNIRKSYPLVLVQYTDLLKSNIKHQNQLDQVLTTQDVIHILDLIKHISLRFENQYFLPFDLYHAKATLFTLIQGKNEESLLP